MGRREVAGELARFGSELEAQGAAQVDGTFTTYAVDNELIECEPNAFLFGLLFTQGIPAERAWAGPARLLERFGTLDPRVIAGDPEGIRAAVQSAPMLHRFKETLPRWIVSAADRLASQYGGDASLIWTPGTHVLEVIERLCEFDGIGRKKAVMAAEILMRHFRVPLAGREFSTVAYDVQVRRVFLRTGLVDHDNRDAMEAAAAEFSPEAPGTLDLPAWLIGRLWCRPTNPACDDCRVGEVCPRLTERSVSGVGSVRHPEPV